MTPLVRMKEFTTIHKNEFFSEVCSPENETHLLSSSSFYLTKRESEYLEQRIQQGEKLRNIIPQIHKKYAKLLIRRYRTRTKVKKTIQSREGKKKRFAYRPISDDWVEIQMMSLSLGISCSLAILELIRLEMDQFIREILSHVELIDAITTYSYPNFTSLTIHHYPHEHRTTYNHIYCPEIEINLVPS